MITSKAIYGIHGLLILLLHFGFNYADDDTNRIIDGRDALVEEFPYQISLELLGQHSCGGSILSETVILTAAHCVELVKNVPEEPHPMLSVRVGATRVPIDGQLHQVKSVTVHELYDPDASTDTNDVALVYLMEPIAYGDRVQPVALSTFTPPSGTMVDITGYGSQQIEIMRSPGAIVRLKALKKCNRKNKLCRKLRRRASRAMKRSVTTLQAIRVPIVDLRHCEEKYEPLDMTLGPDMICAGFKSGHRDACRGDSGGPAVSNGKLIAITAWGIGCGQEGLPGVYTNIAPHYYWIMTHMYTYDEFGAPTYMRKLSHSG